MGARALDWAYLMEGYARSANQLVFGPAIPAIEAVGYDSLVADLEVVFADRWDPAVGLRISSEFGWVTADKPG